MLLACAKPREQTALKTRDAQQKVIARTIFKARVLVAIREKSFRTCLRLFISIKSANKLQTIKVYLRIRNGSKRKQLEKWRIKKRSTQKSFASSQICAYKPIDDDAQRSFSARTLPPSPPPPQLQVQCERTQKQIRSLLAHLKSPSCEQTLLLQNICARARRQQILHRRKSTLAAGSQRIRAVKKAVSERRSAGARSSCSRLFERDFCWRLFSFVNCACRSLAR